eukprot:3336692-Amphidinium_carterae.1
MIRTAVGQLLWVSQLRVDIAFAVKELSRALQQPDNEDLKNLKQLLSEIHQRDNPLSNSDWAGCNTTRKCTSGTITTCWGSPLLHCHQPDTVYNCVVFDRSRTLCNGTSHKLSIEAQHIKQVIQKMATPKLSKNINMSINTDSSAGKAVASRLGLNKNTKHVQLKYLYMQDIVQRGEMTITKIQTTHNPAD